MTANKNKKKNAISAISFLPKTNTCMTLINYILFLEKS